MLEAKTAATNTEPLSFESARLRQPDTLLTGRFLSQLQGFDRPFPVETKTGKTGLLNWSGIVTDGNRYPLVINVEMSASRLTSVTISRVGTIEEKWIIDETKGRGIKLNLPVSRVRVSRFNDAKIILGEALLGKEDILSATLILKKEFRPSQTDNFPTRPSEFTLRTRSQIDDAESAKCLVGFENLDQVLETMTRIKEFIATARKI